MEQFIGGLVNESRKNITFRNTFAISSVSSTIANGLNIHGFRFVMFSAFLAQNSPNPRKMFYDRRLRTRPPGGKPQVSGRKLRVVSSC